jgi:transposase
MDDVGFGILRCSHELGLSNAEIAEQLNVSLPTVATWLASKTPPSQTPARRAPKVPTQTQREIQRRDKAVTRLVAVRETHKAGKKTIVVQPYSSATLIGRKLHDEGFVYGTSKSNVRRSLQRTRHKNKARRLAPQQDEGDRQARVAFCKRLLAVLASKNCPLILWSDEKIFDSQDHGDKTMWIKKDSDLIPRHRSQSAHQVHVWGVISNDPKWCKLIVHDALDKKAPRYKRGRPRKDEPPRPPKAKKRNVTADIYFESCVKQLFKSKTAAEKASVLLMQDGAKPHTALSTTKRIKKLGVVVLPGWPARSPDLNPIEKVWSHLAKAVSKRGPVTKEKLDQFVVEEWNKLVEEFTLIPNLIAGVKTWCEKVIAAGGAHVK